MCCADEGAHPNTARAHAVLTVRALMDGSSNERCCRKHRQSRQSRGTRATAVVCSFLSGPDVVAMLGPQPNAIWRKRGLIPDPLPGVNRRAKLGSVSKFECGGGLDAPSP